VVDMGHDGEIADFGEIGHAAGVLASAGGRSNRPFGPIYT
jgi:hypothetical protein